MKNIKFKSDWMYSRKGDVIEEGDGVAEILIARNIAEEITAEEADKAKATAAGQPPRVHTVRLDGPGEVTARPPVPSPRMNSPRMNSPRMNSPRRN